MAKKVAVVLAGCGFRDGSEIREAVLTLLALDELGAEAQCLSLRKPQTMVVNHATGENETGVRQIFDESARIARGHVHDLTSVEARQFDACIIPGGFGAALNLCDYGLKGANMKAEPTVETFLRDLYLAKKPIGAVCIAPVLLGRVFGELKPRLTIGTDPSVAADLAAWGAQHVVCAADSCVVDDQHRLVTTPAYMYDTAPLKDIAQGIKKLAQEVLRLS